MAESQNESIAATYAKALLATTEKSGETAGVLAELESLARDVLAHQPRFAEALSSPRIGDDEKLGLIDRTLGGRVSPTLLKFSESGRPASALQCAARDCRELSQPGERVGGAGRRHGHHGPTA